MRLMSLIKQLYDTICICKERWKKKLFVFKKWQNLYFTKCIHMHSHLNLVTMLHGKLSCSLQRQWVSDWGHKLRKWLGQGLGSACSPHHRATSQAVDSEAYTTTRGTTATAAPLTAGLVRAKGFLNLFIPGHFTGTPKILVNKSYLFLITPFKIESTYTKKLSNPSWLYCSKLIWYVFWGAYYKRISQLQR